MSTRWNAVGKLESIKVENFRIAHSMWPSPMRHITTP